MPDHSFDEFVRVSLPSLSRQAYALAGSIDRGEDLLQDTLVKVARAWRRIRTDEGTALAYTRKAMLNTYLSSWRALRRRGQPVPYEDDRPAPDAYHTIDSRDVLRRAMAGLPRDQRAVLVLGYLDDLPDEQIAAILDRRPATVRSLRFRALQTLRKHLSLEATHV